MFAMLLLALLGSAADTITVDDDGPADFATIVDAVAAASSDDVLLVSPGVYAGFDTAKPLSILGPGSGPRPQIAGTTKIHAPRATLAGLEFAMLSVKLAGDRVVIDDCTMGVWSPASGSAALSLLVCHEAIVSRCLVQGEPDWYHESGTGFGLGIAVRAENSQVAVVDCTFTGGDGASEYGRPPYTTGFQGGSALYAFKSSIVVASSSLAGGDGGSGSLGLSDNSGPGGIGLEAYDSTVFVRGDSTDVIQKGYPSGWGYGLPGHSATLDASTLVLSGVTFSVASMKSTGQSTFLVPPVHEPWVTISGSDAPGDVRRIELTGPAGQPALLLLGLDDALVTLPKFEALLWLRLTTLFLVVPVVTTDPAPVMLPLQLPASLSGLEAVTLNVQAAFLQLPSTLKPGKFVLTNPAVLVVRF